MLLIHLHEQFALIFLAQASGRARPSFTSMALADLDESSDINHQRQIIQDTAPMVFGGISLHNLHVI
jgi:hypothetical protein